MPRKLFIIRFRDDCEYKMCREGKKMNEKITRIIRIMKIVKMKSVIRNYQCQ